LVPTGPQKKNAFLPFDRFSNVDIEGRYEAFAEIGDRKMDPNYLEVTTSIQQLSQVDPELPPSTVSGAVKRSNLFTKNAILSMGRPDSIFISPSFNTNKSGADGSRGQHNTDILTKPPLIDKPVAGDK